MTKSAAVTTNKYNYKKVILGLTGAGRDTGMYWTRLLLTTVFVDSTEDTELASELSLHIRLHCTIASSAARFRDGSSTGARSKQIIFLSMSLCFFKFYYSGCDRPTEPYFHSVLFTLKLRASVASARSMAWNGGMIENTQSFNSIQ